MQALSTAKSPNASVKHRKIAKPSTKGGRKQVGRKPLGSEEIAQAIDKLSRRQSSLKTAVDRLKKVVEGFGEHIEGEIKKTLSSFQQELHEEIAGMSNEMRALINHFEVPPSARKTAQAPPSLQSPAGKMPDHRIPVDRNAAMAVRPNKKY